MRKNRLKKPTVREIASYAADYYEPYFDSGELRGEVAQQAAIDMAIILAERIGRPVSKVWARMTVLFGLADPVDGCRCQLCRPPWY